MESLDNRFQSLDAGIIQVLNTDIDSVGVAVYPLSGLVTSENGDSDSVTVVLNSRPTADVTFTVLSSPGSEVTTNISTLTFTPTNWNVPRVITVTGVNDSIQDGNQPFTVQLVSGTSLDPLYDGMVSSIAHGVNMDNDTASVVVTSTAPIPYTTSEDGTSVTFRVRLGSRPTHNVTIPVFSLNPAEGQPSTANLIFTPTNWNVEQNLVVTGINDVDIDGDKLYTIRLDKPVSSDSNYSSLDQIDISLTNLDNDFAGLVFGSHLNLTTGEDGTNDTFTIRLRSRPTANVTVHIESSDLTEGTVSPVSVTFTPATWNNPRTITIHGVNDSLIDGDVWYEIRFPDIVSSDSHYNNLSVIPLPAINLDDDTPGVMYLNASNIITRENQTGVTTFQVRLKTRPTDTVTFPLIESSNTQEGLVSPSHLVFTPSNWNVPQTISIQAVRDWIVDPDVAYEIQFGNLVSDDPLYSDFPVASVPVINQNSDTLGYVLSPALNSINMVITDSGLRDSFTLRLNSKPTGNVIIPFSSMDTDRMAVHPTMVEFTPDNWNTPVTVEVIGLFYPQANPPASSDIRLRMGIWNSSANRHFPLGTSDYSTLALPDRHIATTDNGNFTIRRFNTQRPISVIHPNVGTPFQTNEGGGSIPIRFRLGSEPTAPVTIHISSSRPDEGLPFPSSITIQPEEWEDLFTTMIVGQNDNFLDGNQLYSISFTSSSADPNFDSMSLANLNFRNNDNNTNRLLISPANSSTSRIILTRNPGPRNAFTFTLRMNAQPNGTVIFPLSSGSPSQGILDKAQLEFNSGNWNIPQEVTVQAIDNGSTEVTDYLVFAMPSTSNPVTDPLFHGQSNGLTIFVRNTSPGFILSHASGNTGEWGRRASFSFRLSSPPTANVNCFYYIDNELEGKGITGIIDTSFGIPEIVRRFTRTPSNWNSNATITVEGVDDEIIDGDQPFHVVFLPCSSNDEDYDGLIPPSVPFINEDND
jgi:hypothetical protein